MSRPKPVGILPFVAAYVAAALFWPLGRGSGQDSTPEGVDRTRIADYDIQVTLDPAGRRLVGRETISWLNADGPATDELQLHLYMNAFRSPGTLFFAGRGARGVGTAGVAGGWSAADAGWIDIERIGLPDGTDLSGGARVDETVLTVALPQPVEAGQRLRLEIEFSVQLPRVFARTGYSDDYYLVAQWFPKLGVYLDGRWICPQYRSHTEFFSDFGHYRVEITVPRDYEVGATGIRERARTQGETKTLVYTAHPVHDFAWAASPRFRLVRRQLRYRDGGGDRELELHLLMQRDRLDQADAYAEAVRRAVTSFAADYGPYPYAKLTVVDPAPGRGLNSGGMEYPTLIVGGSRWLDTYLFPGGLPLERVTIHEFGHQYWYGVVANNEFEEAWLDEGLTTYTADRVVDSYGPIGAERFFPKILADTLAGLHPFRRGFDFGFGNLAPLLKLGIADTTTSLRRAEYLRRPNADPIDVEAYRPYDSAAYTVSAYSKPTLALRTLEHLVGPRTVREILRTFYERFRFRHPTGEDFRALAGEAAGDDLGWFFDQVWDGTAALDYAVAGIGVRRRGEDGRRVSEVTVTRRGGVVVPQTVAVTLADGTELEFPWEREAVEGGRIWMDDFEPYADAREVDYRLRQGRGGRWLRIEVRAAEPASSAQVDPGYGYLLDVNLANNSYRREPRPSLAARGELAWARLLGRWLHGLSVYN